MRLRRSGVFSSYACDHVATANRTRACYVAGWSWGPSCTHTSQIDWALWLANCRLTTWIVRIDVGAKEATLGDFATASSPDRDLEIAVFRRSLGAGEGHLAAALAWYLDEAGFGPGGNGAGEF